MDAAATMIEKAIVANPTYAEAYNNLGPLSTVSLSVFQPAYVSGCYYECY